MNEKFEKYMNLILKRNEEINLTAITDPEEFMVKHFEDSISITDFPEYIEADTVMDLGTGAGFPGVPLAITSEEKKFTLVDSLNKRLKVIEEFCSELKISNVKTVHGRAEELARKPELRDSFDLVVSRAVANLTTLTELALPFVNVGGYFLSYKGPEAEEELKDAKKAIESLGGKYIETRETKMEKYGISHNIVIIGKEKPTPKKFPRKPGEAGRNPIR